MDSVQQQPHGFNAQNPGSDNQGYAKAPLNVPIAPVDNQQRPLPASPPIQVQPTVISAAPDEADMDKVWVDRAVLLLDQTREDPFVQSQEIAKLKAQYVQSRFEREIKVVQEQK